MVRRKNQHKSNQQFFFITKRIFNWTDCSLVEIVETSKVIGNPILAIELEPIIPIGDYTTLSKLLDCVIHYNVNHQFSYLEKHDEHLCFDMINQLKVNINNQCFKGSINEFFQAQKLYSGRVEKQHYNSFENKLVKFPTFSSFYEYIVSFCNSYCSSLSTEEALLQMSQDSNFIEDYLVLKSIDRGWWFSCLKAHRAGFSAGIVAIQQLSLFGNPLQNLSIPVKNSNNEDYG